MTDALNKLLWMDEKLTLKEQVDLADKLLDLCITQLNDTFPDIHLWQSGHILFNQQSIFCDEAVKLQLLGMKKVNELIDKCPNCTKEYPNAWKVWHLESYIAAGKRALKENGKTIQHQDN